MKTNMILMAAALFLLCAACCKKDELEIFEPGDQAYGTMQADKKVNWIGKEKWTASGVAIREQEQPDRLFRIGGRTYSEDGEERESLTIFEIPLSKGTYPIFTNREDAQSKVYAVYGRRISDGDVVGALYRPTKSNQNCITVTEIDTVSGTVKGRFRVEFSIVDEYDNSEFPDCVLFKNGTFDLKFRD
jgi:hypothetical protein